MELDKSAFACTAIFLKTGIFSELEFNFIALLETVDSKHDGAVHANV